MNEAFDGFRVELGNDEVKVLYYAVCEAIRVWPGSPARPAEEQEHLKRMKNALFSMMLEISYQQ